MKDNALNQHIEVLNEGYELQLHKFRKLYLLTEKQQQALANNDMDIVLELLEQREKIMVEVDQLNNKLAQIQSEVCGILNVKEFSISTITELVNIPACTQLGKVLAEISGLLLEMNQMDTGNQKELTNKINTCLADLNKIKNGNQARHAYLDSHEEYYEPRFFDKTK